jgi:hypothetical protein
MLPLLVDGKGDGEQTLHPRPPPVHPLLAPVDLLRLVDIMVHQLQVPLAEPPRHLPLADRVIQTMTEVRARWLPRGYLGTLVWFRGKA